MRVTSFFDYAGRFTGTTTSIAQAGFRTRILGDSADFSDKHTLPNSGAESFSISHHFSMAAGTHFDLRTMLLVTAEGASNQSFVLGTGSAHLLADYRVTIEVLAGGGYTSLSGHDYNPSAVP